MLPNTSDAKGMPLGTQIALNCNDPRQQPWRAMKDKIFGLAKDGGGGGASYSEPELILPFYARSGGS